MSFKWRTALWMSATMLLILLMNGIVFLQFYTQTMLDDQARSLLQSATKWEMKLHAPQFLALHLGWVSNPDDKANEPPLQPGIESLEDVLNPGQQVRIWSLGQNQGVSQPRLIREFYLEDSESWRAIRAGFGWQENGVALQQRIGGTDYFIVQTTIQEQKLGGSVGLQFIEMAAPFEERIALIRNRVLWGLLANGLLVLGIAYLLARKTIQPLSGMIRDIRNMDGQHLQQRLVYPRAKDELYELSVHFNGLLERLEQSMDRQKQLVADASHEFRTPLTIIEGHANLIKRWGKHNPDVLEESIDTIVNESERMKQLASQLLVLATLDADHDQADRQHIEEMPMTELSGLIKELIRRFRGLDPEIEFEELLPAEPLLVNMPQLYSNQVFTNLIDNAIKYGGTGKRVRMKGRVLADCIEVTVQDFGVGISLEELPHIFDRFYRADASRNRGTGGVGLGLSIVKKIVEQHGGSIQVQSILDHGTTMTVRLPRSMHKV